LCEFAAKTGFDPLIAENWEKCRWPEVKKLVSSMAKHFDWNPKRVIADAFPELCFSKSWLLNMRHDSTKRKADGMESNDGLEQYTKI